MGACCENSDGIIIKSSVQGFVNTCCRNCGFGFMVSEEELIMAMISAIKAGGRYTNIEVVSEPWRIQRRES